jgi:hypothetical protein
MTASHRTLHPRERLGPAARHRAAGSGQYPRAAVLPRACAARPRARARDQRPVVRANRLADTGRDAHSQLRHGRRRSSTVVRRCRWPAARRRAAPWLRRRASRPRLGTREKLCRRSFPFHLPTSCIRTVSGVKGEACSRKPSDVAWTVDVRG